MKSSRSVIQKRQDKIMNHLAQYQTAEVVALANWLGISEITVRRDLDQMSRKGLVERFSAAPVWSTRQRSGSLWNL